MSDKPTLQHYVPRFYLKYFSIPETQNNRNPQIWVFSKEHNTNPFKTAIRNVAAERYFYSPINSNGERDWKTEEKLSDLENILSQIWNELANGFVNLENHSIRKAIALFISTLYLRSPNMIGEIKGIHKQIVDFVEPLPKKLMNYNTYKEFNEFKNVAEDYFRGSFVDSLNNYSSEVAEILLKKRWSIIFAEEHSFITSDSPVTIYNPYHKAFGLNTKGTMVIFPISPTRVLMMDDMYEQPNSQYYLLDSYGPGKVNYFIWINVIKFMFSWRNIDEVLAEIIKFADRMQA